MYDIISTEGETREQWDLDETDKRLIKEHIFAQDYAESPCQLKALAQTQGFTQTECLFTDTNKIFSAFSFQK